jgi:hypothetical protein
MRSKRLSIEAARGSLIFPKGSVAICDIGLKHLTAEVEVTNRSQDDALIVLQRPMNPLVLPKHLYLRCHGSSS